ADLLARRSGGKGQGDLDLASDVTAPAHATALYNRPPRCTMPRLRPQANGPASPARPGPGRRSMRDHIRFSVNGRLHAAHGDAAFASLTDFLRAHQGLVGTKVVCAEGDCGACTVLVGRPDGERLHYLPVDACIQFLYQLDGTHVVTVEGLKDGENLHPVQQA